MPTNTTRRRKKEPSKRARGRPSRIIDAKVTSAICKAIAGGVPFKYACEANGISERTGHEWVRRGDEAKPGDEEFSAFSAAVTRARAKAVVSLVSMATVDGPAGARWILERRYAHDFASKQKLEHSGPDGGPIRIDKPVGEMSDDELVQIANAGNGA